MRTALTVKQAGIFRCDVKSLGLDNPHQHLLAVGSRHHAALHRWHGQLCEYIVVDSSELGDVAGCGVDRENLVRIEHGVAHGHEPAVGCRQQGGIVAFSAGDLSDLGVGQSDVEYGHHAIFVGPEVETASVRGPCYIVDGIVPFGSEVCFGTRSHVEEKYAVLVAFISVVLHAEPCQSVAVGREHRIGVVAHHALGEVSCLAGGKVVDVEVGVGGQGILHAGFLAAHIDELTAVGTPCKGFHPAERLHGSFIEGLVGHDVGHLANGRTVEIGDERMRDFRDPFVPVLVHHVVYDAAGGLGQIRIDVLRGARPLYAAYHHHFLLIGREKEAVDAGAVGSDLPPVRSVGIHHPYLRFAFRVGIEERDGLSAVGPHRIAFGSGSAGYAHVVGAVGIHHVKIGVGAVVLHAFIAYRVEYLAAVGRQTGIAHAAEGLECVDGEHTVGRGKRRFVDNLLILRDIAGTCRSQRRHTCHSQRFQNFLHYLNLISIGIICPQSYEFNRILRNFASDFLNPQTLIWNTIPNRTNSLRPTGDTCAWPVYGLKTHIACAVRWAQ